MRLEQIDHVALRCASPEQTMAWYLNTLGFEHVFPGQWSGRPLFLRLGSTYLALFPRKDLAAPQVGAVSHLAFRAATRADFAAAQAQLRAQAIPFDFQDHEISHSIYFSDPDGLPLEITTYDVPVAAARAPARRHAAPSASAPTFPALVPPTPMNTKQLAQTWFDELWNKKNAAIIDEMMDPAAAGVSEGGPVIGPANFKLMVYEPLVRAFPDMSLTVDGVIAEGDQAVVRWTASGTHRGPMMHLNATGKRVRFSGMSWLQFKDGKIVGGSDSFNLHGLFAALGQDAECGSVRLEHKLPSDMPHAATAGARTTPQPLASATTRAGR